MINERCVWHWVNNVPPCNWYEPNHFYSCPGLTAVNGGLSGICCLPDVIHGIIAEPLSTYRDVQKALYDRFHKRNNCVPAVPFSGNTYVVYPSASTIAGGPHDHRTVGCSTRLEPRISAHSPVTHLYTYSFIRGVCCTCPLTGGHGAEKVTSLIGRVLVGVLLAPCRQFCEQGLTTLLHMGGTWCVVVPLRIVQSCTSYGADIVHFGCSWTTKVNK